MRSLYTRQSAFVQSFIRRFFIYMVVLITLHVFFDLPGLLNIALALTAGIWVDRRYEKSLDKASETV
jgi:hypothetical protein